MIVVDASLAVKWLLPETDMARALAFAARHDGELCGPDLLFIEVASALVRRANENKTLRPMADVLLERWIESWTNDVVAPHALTQGRLQRAAWLALDLGHPLPDCIYLALAIELDADLATCDVKFATKAARCWPRVRLLESYAA